MNARFFVSTALVLQTLMAVNCYAAGPNDAMDRTQFIPSPLPGYAKAQNKCMSCHNAESTADLPADTTRAQWESLVRRMKRVFRARMDDAEMADIADYLTKTYGNEKGDAVAQPAPQTLPTTQPLPATAAVTTTRAQPVAEPPVVAEPNTMQLRRR